MIDERKFAELRKRAESARAASDRAVGQLDAAMKRLEDEFGCKTLKTAEKKLAELQAEAKDAETKYAAAMERFEEEWGQYAECAET